MYVVLETTLGAVPRMRWSFSEIAERSFRWTNEIEESAAWRTQQTFGASRRQ